MARTPKVVEDRREQIIDAAMRVFAQKGFIRATNKDIAREAGITPGLIYHYFENKEAVLKALIEVRSPLIVLRTLPASMLAQPPETLLPFLVKEILHIVEDEQFVQLIRVLLPEIVFHPDMAGTATGIIHQAMGFLINYLQLQMVHGALRETNAELAAQMLLGSIIAFVLRRQILHDPQALHYTQEQLAQTITETMLQGLLPR